MILFSNQITPRLQYISSFVSAELGTTAITITGNREEYINYHGPRINYSNEPILPEEIHIKPSGLLEEKVIRQPEITCGEKKGVKYFFQVGGELGFDVFSAAFYLLSRYEEYLPHSKDSYGRYAHENSIAWKEKFLNVPLVNRWLEELRELLKKKFPVFIYSHGLENKKKGALFIPTYDIDEAYSYRYKQWWRSAGGGMRDLLKGDLKHFRLRRQVLNGMVQDPFDSYAWMDDLHRPLNFQPRYFFLVASNNSRYDKNILPVQEPMQSLIRKHASAYKIGLHPSWQSGDQPGLLQKELEEIQKISGQKITSSRQHYIRMSMPATYRQLIDAGIKEDFSMGYGSINGFRASAASPFYWYDLEREKTTDLLLYPFCFMEANSFYEQKMNANAALEEMRSFYSEVDAVKGLMITIWHNTFLGTSRLYAGWREVYRQFINEIARK